MTSTRVFFDTLLSNGCRACVAGVVGWWNGGLMEYWIGVYRAEFVVVNGGAGRVYSLQFTVFSLQLQCARQLCAVPAGDR